MDYRETVATRDGDGRTIDEGWDELGSRLVMVIVKTKLTIQIVAKGEDLPVVAEDKGVVTATSDLDDFFVCEIEH